MPPHQRVTPVLAPTKLHIPALRPGHVHRAELVRALVAGTETRITVVSAAPGSGKTSLLSEWLADPDERRPFAWISLDAADNDPVRFCGGLFVVDCSVTHQPRFTRVKDVSG